MHTRTARRSNILLPLALGLWGSAAGLAQSPGTRLALVLPAIAAGAAWWSVLRPHRWLLLFFGCLLLTPPLPLPLGDSGVHFAPAFILLGLVAGVIYISRWRTDLPSPAVPLLLFFMVLLVSGGAAALYSGADIALRSLLRAGLFGIGVYVFLYAIAGPRLADFNPLHMAKFLYWAGIAAAIFACADYYFQFPAPAGFEAQFIWLDEGVFRRAQGLFYDASTLGNFCAFFLALTMVSLLRPRAEAPCSRYLLALGGVVFAAALILSYSRASVVNVLVAGIALAFARGRRIARPLLALCFAAGAGGFAVRFALPSFWASYWGRAVNSLEYFSYSPNGILSGRLTSWSTIGDFLLREPWHTVFGIGYKTLPYTNYLGASVIADNTWLSVLAETGIIGLAAFVALNAAIVRSAWRAARSANPRAAFFGEWIFCFWAGEMAQMLSGDLLTYWRVLPLYFWVLGTAVREMRGAE